MLLSLVLLLLLLLFSAFLPGFIPTIIADRIAQREHGVHVLTFPMHPCPFESSFHEPLVRTFHHA
jgi:hypothetical protein